MAQCVEVRQMKPRSPHSSHSHASPGCGASQCTSIHTKHVGTGRLATQRCFQVSPRACRWVSSSHTRDRPICLRPHKMKPSSGYTGIAIKVSQALGAHGDTPFGTFFRPTHWQCAGRSQSSHSMQLASSSVLPQTCTNNMMKSCQAVNATRRRSSVKMITHRAGYVQVVIVTVAVRCRVTLDTVTVQGILVSNGHLVRLGQHLDSCRPATQRSVTYPSHLCLNTVGRLSRRPLQSIVQEYLAVPGLVCMQVWAWCVE